MRKPVMLVFVAALFGACGSKGEPGQDWSGRPLEVTIEESVNGVAFTIQAPKGLKHEADRATEVTRWWRADVHDYFSEPSFTVSYESIPAKDLAGFIRGSLLDADEVIAKQEELADGFVLVHHNPGKSLAYAQVLTRKGDVHLRCSASQARDGGLPSFERTLAWLEALCRSLTIQGS
jgi:hypothetical protein